MDSSRDVVITGIGIVSPLGIGRALFEQSLLEGHSGVGAITSYDTSAMSVKIGAELRDFEPKLYVQPRKSIKVMCREIQTGVASANLAMEDAELNSGSLDADRFGVVYGVPMLYAEVSELADLVRACVKDGAFDFAPFGVEFGKQLIPLWMLKYLPNMVASHIGIAHQARGPSNSIVHGDVSSLLAIVEAATVIQRGLADVMLTGGTGSRLALTPVVYRGDRNLSKRNQQPEAASRPFDADRDGMVLGEGSGSFLLESRAHAEARGASIYGTIRSYSSTHRGSSLAGMQSAIERSILGCLAMAGVAPDDVDHVNAHGSSEIGHDRLEATAIRATLGDVLVTAPKCFLGNVGAASGVLELAASLTLMRRGRIPQTLNYERPDDHCPVNVVARSGVATQGRYVVKMNQAASGQAVAVLVERPPSV